MAEEGSDDFESSGTREKELKGDESMEEVLVRIYKQLDPVVSTHCCYVLSGMD